jgi:hypothetical protein
MGPSGRYIGVNIAKDASGGKESATYCRHDPFPLLTPKSFSAQHGPPGEGVAATVVPVGLALARPTVETMVDLR